MGPFKELPPWAQEFDQHLAAGESARRGETADPIWSAAELADILYRLSVGY